METQGLQKIDESGLTKARVGMKRSILTDMLAQSEHIRGLIQLSAAAVASASSGMQPEFANSEPLPGARQVLDHHAAATEQLREAVERLAALDQVLHDEIRERTLIDHQLAAAFEQEEGSRNAALHDQLTGLANRALFHDRLEHGIAQASRHGWMLAVMFVDLDDFKGINDSHGHHAGDAVLRSVAFRLKQTMRHEDTVSRYGGDEFLCLLTPLHERADIASIATKVLAAIRAPCELQEWAGAVTVSVGGSIGISVFPEHGTSAGALIRLADEAMYVAKQNKLGYAFAP